ncbi:hypothetical protein [Burkholderia seminalis]|uniref:hypothetical protein n=1 Tax=Burkholderia seminalis TaxID=488731 RepID=UPI001902E0EF|nr:hypothetical protein [Burkholderia seminalis]MBJ9964484.1 hypothetical protein [Burkholderia seminalis]
MPKIIELVSPDYYASPNDHVVVPDGMDLNAERNAYTIWLRDVYQPGFQFGPKVEYMTFCGWLLSRGARKPNDEEFTTFQE